MSAHAGIIVASHRLHVNQNGNSCRASWLAGSCRVRLPAGRLWLPAVGKWVKVNMTMNLSIASIKVTLPLLFLNDLIVQTNCFRRALTLMLVFASSWKHVLGFGAKVVVTDTGDVALLRTKNCSCPLIKAIGWTC